MRNQQYPGAFFFAGLEAGYLAAMRDLEGSRVMVKHRQQNNLWRVRQSLCSCWMDSKEDFKQDSKEDLIEFRILKMFILFVSIYIYNSIIRSLSIYYDVFTCWFSPCWRSQLAIMTTRWPSCMIHCMVLGARGKSAGTVGTNTTSTKHVAKINTCWESKRTKLGFPSLDSAH